MPPKATVIERELANSRLLYAMILQVGQPSGGAAWDQIAAMLPPAPDRAAHNRRDRLEKSWDDNKIFGERHNEIVEEAVRASGKERRKILKK